MFCNKCGKELHDGDIFCPGCGNKVERTQDTEEISSGLSGEEEAGSKMSLAFNWDLDDFNRSRNRNRDVKIEWGDLLGIDERKKPAETNNGFEPAVEEVEEEPLPVEEEPVIEEIEEEVSVEEEMPLNLTPEEEVFYTFDRKKKEFQDLLDKERKRVTWDKAEASLISEDMDKTAKNHQIDLEAELAKDQTIAPSLSFEPEPEPVPAPRQPEPRPVEPAREAVVDEPQKPQKVEMQEISEEDLKKNGNFFSFFEKKSKKRKGKEAQIQSADEEEHAKLLMMDEDDIGGQWPLESNGAVEPIEPEEPVIEIAELEPAIKEEPKFEPEPELEVEEEPVVEVESEEEKEPAVEPEPEVQEEVRPIAATAEASDPVKRSSENVDISDALFATSVKADNAMKNTQKLKREEFSDFLKQMENKFGLEGDVRTASDKDREAMLQRKTTTFTPIVERRNNPERRREIMPSFVEEKKPESYDAPEVFKKPELAPEPQKAKEHVKEEKKAPTRRFFEIKEPMISRETPAEEEPAIYKEPVAEEDLLVTERTRKAVPNAAPAAATVEIEKPETERPSQNADELIKKVSTETSGFNLGNFKDDKFWDDDYSDLSDEERDAIERKSRRGSIIGTVIIALLALLLIAQVVFIVARYNAPDSAIAQFVEPKITFIENWVQQLFR